MGVVVVTFMNHQSLESLMMTSVVPSQAQLTRREDDLPRERLARCGAPALRDEELLAIVLGTGVRGTNVVDIAREILLKHPPEQLVTIALTSLQDLRGLGQAKAGILVAAFELARRGLGQGLGLLPSINGPADALPLLTEIKDQRKEFFLCLYLNARNQLIHKEIVSIGSLSASIVHPREVFQMAVVKSAASILLAHNHPSGDVTPSRDDVDLTRRLQRAGEIMGVDILDHLIIAADQFLSLKEQGYM